MTISIISKEEYLNDLAEEAFRIIALNSKFQTKKFMTENTTESNGFTIAKNFYEFIYFLLKKIRIYDSISPENSFFSMKDDFFLPDNTSITFVGRDFSAFATGIYLQFMNLFPHRNYHFFRQIFPPRENFEINIVFAHIGKVIFSKKVIFANSLNKLNLDYLLMMNTLQLICELTNKGVFNLNSETAQEVVQTDLKTDFEEIGPKAENFLGLARYLYSFLFSKFWKRSWKIGIYSKDENRTQLIKAPPGRWLADPFLFEFENLSYLFFEDFSKQTRKGSISFSVIENGHVGSIKPCILEDFHLSFPRVFVVENEIFMSVESVAVGGVRIYRALEFPFIWELEVHVLKDLLLVDPIVVCQNNLWFLLATEKTLVGDDFYSRFNIFISHSPLIDSWNPHPMNPIYVDCSKGRNAGLLQEGDHITRFAQAFSGGIYGSDLQEYSILRLDAQFFQEIPSETVNFKRPKKFKQFHTYSVNSKFESFDFK